MPSWPIEMPSETEIVPNSIGNPPAARTPSLARLASRSSERLQGVISFHDDATPICGLTQSSSPMPTARSMARAGPSRRRRSPPSCAASWAVLAGWWSRCGRRSSTLVTSGDGRPRVRRAVRARVGGWPVVTSPARLRMNRTALFPVGLLALCTIPLAFAAPVDARPAGHPARGGRSGCSASASTSATTASRCGPLAGQRQVPWAEVAGIRVARARRPLAGHDPRHRAPAAGDAGPRPPPPRGASRAAGSTSLPPPPPTVSSCRRR